MEPGGTVEGPGSTSAPTGGQVPSGAVGGPEGNGALPLQPAAVPAADVVPVATPGRDEESATAPPPKLENVLVFSRTAGFRHEAIGAGIESIRTLGAANGFAVAQTEDAAQFTDARLAGFDVVIWLSTSADVLDDTQQGAFERYIQGGGGWVGVHAASDTEYAWAWYGQLLGGAAYFKNHPAIQVATIHVEQAGHPSTAHLAASFQLQDELYNFYANPRSSVTVLMTLDESSYQPGEGAMGADHPIAWYHEFDGGRAWYTALGHRPQLYADPRFTQHLLGGIRWAAGVAP